MTYASINMVKEQTQSTRELLRALESSQDGCIYVVRDRIRWAFYVVNGKLVYASHSLENFERVERHLRGLSREVPALNDQLRSQLRMMFDVQEPDNVKYKVTSENLCTEYLAILWLVEENFLLRPIASKLVARIIQEVIESFLCLPMGQFESVYYKHLLKDTYCNLAIPRILEVVENRLQVWHSLGPEVVSPYQCPYLVSKELATTRMSADTVQRLSRILRGFNFCQLGILIGKDPLAIAKQFSPFIKDGLIALREPLSPFDLLPRTYYPPTDEDQQTIKQPATVSESTVSQSSETDDDISSISQGFANQPTKTWKIVCIDDNASMLSIISSYLGSEDFQVTLIQDSMRALMKINSIRPDLILLDIGMPNVDGYKLCTLIRKSSTLKEIPIVMVTGNKGILDRARARMSGATDYLVKPFVQADLLNMVMRHLM